MKLNRIAHYYVTLAVFLMFTVAIVASQVRATQQRLFVELRPVAEDAAGKALVNVALQLKETGRLEAL